MIPGGDGKPWANQDLESDTSRFRYEVGFAERTDLRMGLERTVEWQRDHPRTSSVDYAAEDVLISEYGTGRLRHLCAGGYRLARRHHDHLAGDRIGGGQEHALAHFAAQGTGLEVGDDDDLFADQLLGGDVAAKAGADLAAVAGF